MSENTMANPVDTLEIDPIWTSSRTARQIYALREVEKVRSSYHFIPLTERTQVNQDISRLLSLAASSISLLTLPQTDGPEDNLPQGDERSEQFVLEVSEYFERLDVSSIIVPVISHCSFRLLQSLSKKPFVLLWHTYDNLG